MTMRFLVLAALAAAFIVTGCGRESGESATRAHATTIRVLAASSLSNAVTTISDRFEQRTNIHVELSFDATSRLAHQVQEGAPADVLISADRQWMNELIATGFVHASGAHDWVGNSLVVITPRRDAVEIQSLADLRQHAVRHLALAAPAVPASQYAEQALTRAGVLSELQRSIVRAPNVRATLAYVAEGNAEAGIVYATDARIDTRVRVAYAIDASSHEPIVYALARLAHAASWEGAQRFVDYCRSEASMTLLREQGFVPLAQVAYAP
ncbi:MAG: molybdate ABC transporter substrate-binding protein [Sandaracinaceae bacterium]|nr:molybdate ABC transporter substrate-binding protein [Sandaracinaceae bacterium]